MKMRVVLAAMAGALAITAATAEEPFIELGFGTRVVFESREIDGKIVSVATVTVVEVDEETGKSSYKTLEEKKVPNDDGGFTQIVEQIALVVQENPEAPGTFTVVTTTVRVTTPVDESGQPAGEPVTSTDETPPQTYTQQELEEHLPKVSVVEIPAVEEDPTVISPE